MLRLGNNEVLKTLTKTLTFVDANADAEGSTIALRERCLGELKLHKYMYIAQGQGQITPRDNILIETKTL